MSIFNKKKGESEVKPGKIKPFVLLSIDGWGVAPASQGNAIHLAKTPNMDKYIKTYPYGELIAAGESVGLPANEAGNSEVGHLLMGVGRVVYQSLPRIHMAIEDGSFYDNKAFLAALDHVRNNNSKLHLMGLISSGAVHSSIDHLWAFLEFCRRNKIQKVALHLFTDGRDAPPDDGIKVITEVQERLDEIRLGHISTVSGRYFAMDRDGRWDRTKKAYDAIVLGKGVQAKSAVDAVKQAYANGQTDEFIEPTVIIQDNMTTRLGPHTAKVAGTVDDNDSVIFFNFRIDRPRQLSMAFCLQNFESLKTVDFGYVPHETRRDKEDKKEKAGPTFKREKWPKNIFFVTMTEYQKSLPVSAVAYPPFVLENSLPEVLSKSGYKHVHLAESEKERMVTFYFNGMKDEKFEGEEDVIIPSPSVGTYDKKPEMSVYKIAKRFRKLLSKDKYHFFIINYANPDMVAHSGNMQATIKACEHVDKAVAELVDATLAKDGTVFITADHGNAEDLLTFPSTSYFITSSEGEMNTEHSNNPVPLIVIDRKLQGNTTKLPKGTLADIAPSMLAMMGIPAPKEMTGRNLFGPPPEKGTDEDNPQQQSASQVGAFLV